MLRSEKSSSEYQKISPFESESLDPESLEIIPGEDTAPPQSLVLSLAYRLCILFTGMCLGFMTFMPNAMMSDSGTRLAVTFSGVGLTASLLFCVAGVVGAVTKKWNLFKYACGMQLLAFSPLLITTLLWLLGLREEP
jgi:hypothetical protein